MDSVKARDLEAALKGQIVGGCEVLELLDHGKSAAVFRAIHGADVVALKIFDDELIEKYGDKTQLERIKRELTLVGHSHPNMVSILGGGFDPISHNHYIVMEYVEGPNLAKTLDKIPVENIGHLAEQLASCAEFLEKLGLVHRDIKPENIIVTEEFSRLILLDFGVLRPIGQTGLTDGEGIQWFVGTLQYSSPEFLLRQEKDDVEGWRALSLYQIGGVLHDLIMKAPLFADQIQPFARLVNAVQHDTPQIHNPAVPGYLIDIARSALAKDPAVRNTLLNWKSFSPPPDSNALTQQAKHRVTNRSALIQPTPEPSPNDYAVVDLISSVVNGVKIHARAIRSANSTALPPVLVTRKDNAVTVRFLESDSASIPIGLSVRLTITAIDASVNAVAISACAYAGDFQPEFESDVCIMRGIYTPDALSASLESCIYLAADQAQQSSDPKVSQALDLTPLNVEAN